MQLQTKPRTVATSTRSMHQVVVAGAGIWLLFMVTFAIAYYRVSQHNKYKGLPLKSQTMEQPQRSPDSY